MTNNAQRIAIAESIGRQASVILDHRNCELPDDQIYPAGPGTMTKALRRLDDEEWLEYMLTLCDVTRTHIDSGKWTTVRALVGATVAQQAEAFLKVKGKWDDEK